MKMVEKKNTMVVKSRDESLVNFSVLNRMS